MDALLRDLRLAVRSLWRTPGFTIAVVLILALGIGMATAMFTVFKTVLVDRLPIAAQDRVVVMHTLDRSGRNLDAPNPYLPVMARDSALFRGVAGAQHLGADPVPFLTKDGRSIELGAVQVSANFFQVLGTRPVIGRLFRPEDGQPGAPPVLVLSYAAWRRRFGGDQAIVGRTLVVPYFMERARIVGVAPPGLVYPAGVDVWRPLPPDVVTQIDIVARLAPGVTIGAARTGLLALTRRVNPFEVGPPPHVFLEISGVTAQSFADTVLGRARPAIVALTLAVGLLLLIACVNIGNLSLVRLLGRTREIAVRRALGASTADVVRGFAVENGLLGVLGGALGLVTAVAALHIVRAAAPPQLPRADALGGVGAPLAAAVGVTLLALALFAVLPTLIAARIRSYAALRADARSGTETRSGRRARRWLVATQIALAVVMLSGAGLLVHTLARLEAAELGFRPDHLSLLSFTAPQSDLPTPDRIYQVARQLVARIAATPGVVAATPVESPPFKGQSFFLMKLASTDQPATERERNPFIPFEYVGPDYFRTFEIPILRGRGFTAEDSRGSQRVAVVNETLARQLWPGRDPLGMRLMRNSALGDDTAYTVVGIVHDTRFRELRNVGPVVYFDWEQVQPTWFGYVAVRTTPVLPAMVSSLRAATRETDPNLVLYDGETMDHLLDAPLAQPRLSAWLLTAFALVALLLSAIGLYGVMSSGVRQQTRDIGVRVALGATPDDVRRLVLGQAGSVVVVGAAAGLAAALATSRLLGSLLYDVSPTDPVTLAGACLLLVVVALLAAYLPARRATRVDPVEALRAE